MFLTRDRVYFYRIFFSMKTIIAPTDFSDVSLNAVYYAADMASTVNANLLILHATEAPFSRAGISSASGYDEISTEEKLYNLKKI